MPEPEDQTDYRAAVVVALTMRARANAALTAVAIVKAEGRPLGPGVERGAEDLNARAARAEAVVVLWDRGDDGPTWTPPPYVRGAPGVPIPSGLSEDVRRGLRGGDSSLVP